MGWLFLCGVLTGIAAPVADSVLVWHDEFNQPENSAPDPTKWVYDLGENGWGNQELERYTDARENSFVISDPTATDGKALAIRAVHRPGGGYTSARLKTAGRFTTAGGRIEARIKLPRGRGIWPAFWMLGANIESAHWPACGEIDVMESLGHEPATIYGTLHGPGYSGAKGIGEHFTPPGGSDATESYHLFAVEWLPNKITWMLDGQVYHVCTPANLPAGTKWVFNNSPFFLLLNLAVGGGWPGNPDDTTAFPQTLLVDYVRVYRLEESAGGPSSVR